MLTALDFDDATFDTLLPIEIRRLSHLHWTPVAVARRAAEWLVAGPETRVLDVGAGPGKLCCIGALHRGGRWHGIEREPAHVRAATALAAALAIADRATFALGEATAADVDWRAFDAIYLYNPFETLFGRPHPAHVAATRARLAAQPSGTRVVTFHGYGDDVPATFRLAATQPGGLQLWIN